MLRITKVSERPQSVTLQLEGRVAGDGLEVLAAECRHWRACGKRARLDLARVAFVDSPGADLLRSLRRQGVEVTGAPPLIEDVLTEKRDP